MAASTEAAAPATGASLRVVYVVYDEVLHSLIDSQVVEPLVAVAAEGLEIELVVYVSPRALVSPGLRQQHRQRLTELKGKVPGKVKFLTHGPRHSMRNLSTHKLVKRQKRALKERVPVIVHARGPHAAILALPVSRRYESAAVIFDSRGLAAEEFRYASAINPRMRARAIEIGAEQQAGLERAAAQDAEIVFTVSNALASVFESEYRIPHEKIRVMPTLVDTIRFRPDDQARSEVRRELEIAESARVVAYSGSAAPWQMPFATAQLVASMRTRDPSTVYMVISPDALHFRLAAESAGIPSEAMRMVCVRHDLVPRYLAAADVGVLLREESPVSRVSSPVSLAECMAVGLPVVLGRGIGDASAQVEEEGIGVTVDVADVESFGGVISSLDRLGERGEIAARARAHAEREHGRSTVVKRAIVEYRALAAEVIAR